MPIPLPAWLIYFIGTCEVLGGLSLIVPGVIRRFTWLMPLAAVCLVALTVCAATYQLLAGQPANAVFALVIGLLCASVAYGRTKVSPAASAPTTPRRAADQAALLA